MKRGAIGVIQLALSVLIIYLIDTFFFKVLSYVGFKPVGTVKTIMIFVKYLIICGSVFAIYFKDIKSSKNKVERSFASSTLYCIACFLFLILITILLHQTLNKIGNPRGIQIGYYFKNYFDQKFNLDLILKISIECVFMPFLLCVVFPLGFSKIFKNIAARVTISGVAYGILYAITLNASFEYAIFHAITPMCVVMLLTYLYNTNRNIASVIITYAIYVLFGIFAINYIL